MQKYVSLVALTILMPLLLVGCSLLTGLGPNGEPAPLTTLISGGREALGAAATGDTVGAIAAITGALGIAGFTIFKKLRKKKAK